MAEPIAPTMNPTAPVAPPSATVTVERPKAFDPFADFENAIDTANPEKMYQVAQLTKGTPLSESAINAANIMESNKRTFDEIANRVEKAGGIQSPKGHIEAAKIMEDKASWDKNAVEAPGFWFALGQKLMGDREAFKYVNGGVVKPEIGYADNTGQQLEIWKNQLGRTVKVVDYATRQEIDPAEYKRIGVAIADPTQTLGRKTKDEMRKYNAEQYVKRNEASNDWAAAAPELAKLSGNQQLWLQDLAGSGLSNETLQYLAKFTSRQFGLTTNLQKAQQDFDQFSRNKGENVSESVRKSAEGFVRSMSKALKRPLNLGVDGSITDEKGNKYGTDELTNLQNQFSKSVNAENNYTQTKAEAEKDAVYQGLTKEQKDKFDAVLENASRLALKEQELVRKHGNLPFIVNPSAFKVADQFKRGEIQAIAGQFNAEAIQLFQEWKAKQLLAFEKNNQIPRAGELEAQFVKQPEYLQLVNDYKGKEFDVRNRQDTFAPTIPEAGQIQKEQELVQSARQESPVKKTPPTVKGRGEEVNAELIKRFKK